MPFIAESGIHTPDDVRTVRAAGAWGILVGESLLKDRDIGAKLDELRNA
jgi:indole-3-glycerol phosphate synthase